MISPARDPESKAKWHSALRARWNALLQHREEQVFLALTLLIGALTGLAVVAFIVLTEHSKAIG